MREGGALMRARALSPDARGILLLYQTDMVQARA